MATIPEALTLALQHHQAGDLQQAEQIYRLVLQAEPDNADALHLLGVLALQVGRHDLAVPYLRRALALQPQQAAFHFHLGAVYQALNQGAEAIASYREALRLRPDFAEAHNNLGNVLKALGQLNEAEFCYRQALRLQPDDAAAHSNLAIALAEQGKLDEAMATYRQALRRWPDHAESHFNLGNILLGQGRLEEAGACFRAALRLRPDFAEARANLAHVLRTQGQLEELAACYRDALRLYPENPVLHCGLGSVLAQQGKPEEAMASYQEALRVDPKDIDAYNSLGAVLHTRGRAREAEACFRELVRLRPDFAEAYSNLSVALQTQGRAVEAEACCREALRLQPGYPEASSNLGNILREQGRLGEAESCVREALRQRPDSPNAHNNLGVILREQGRPREAEASYREALRLQPDYAAAHSNLLFCLHYEPAADPKGLLAEHRAWAARYAPTGEAILPHANTRDPGRRLRIGYVSPDLRRHSVAFFIEPVLTHHDAEQVEVFCYAEVSVPDETTARLRARAHHWRFTCGLSDVEVAEQIRADGIDVLVDLAGHTAGHRLLVFARKPAPVQATYLGYPNTTGLEAIDYRLTDALADPPGMTEGYHAERLWRLPGCFLCYRPSPDGPAVGDLPARASGHITFGSFNHLAKVSPATVQLWAEVLRAVPGSRLLLKGAGLSEEKTRQRLQERFAGQGVEMGRLVFSGWEPSDAGHLAQYQRVDVALDTFPYHGTTTTCEALWMGVPVVSLAGDWHASRVGASLLACIGLPELVAQTAEGYVGIARCLAEEQQGLAALRCELRERMRVSALCDADSFTRRLEEAYRQMWQRWCLNPGG